MNRRNFLKNVSASGMVLMAPLSLSSKALAATELTPVGQYFIFAHLGGGWEPTTFCNPQGNKLRSTVGAELGKNANQVRNASSPVNKFPASAIRRAQDIYAGTSSINAELKYAPYLGTFNQAGATAELDDGLANQGLTTAHIQQILSGDIVADLLTAAPSAGFAWQVTKSVVQITANAIAIIEGTVATIELGTIATDELVDRNLALNGTQMAANLFVYDAFVCLHADQMRILNGVDNRTNSHDTGTMYADTGSMSAGYPDFSALYAATQGADRPLAWMTDGRGNDEPAGLVARSSAAAANFFGILGNPTNGMVEPFASALDIAQDKRTQLQASQENLPLRTQYQSQLYLVRDQGLEFAGVAAQISDPETGSAADLIRIAAGNSGMRNHMRIGAAGFSTGMASSMQVGFGGFDTHGDHDNDHYPRIRTVLSDLHYLFQALEVYGVRQQTTIVVGSDFGRTPWYNDGDGKDHWAVTSYMLLGNGVTGGTVVNATNGLIEALNVDPVSMAPLASGGVKITATHIHAQMRKLAQIDRHPFALQFPLEAEEIPIFG